MFGAFVVRGKGWVFQVLVFTLSCWLSCCFAHTRSCWVDVIHIVGVVLDGLVCPASGIAAATLFLLRAVEKEESYEQNKLFRDNKE